MRANLLHFWGTHATWVHYSPRYLIMSLSLSQQSAISKERDDGIIYAFQISLHSPLKQDPNPGLGITVLFRNRTSLSSRFFFSVFFSRPKKEKGLSKNSTKNSFTLHAQLHCLHTARRRASFLSCPGLSLPSSASTIFESSHQAHSSTSMTSSNPPGKKRLANFSFSGDGIVGLSDSI